MINYLFQAKNVSCKSDGSIRLVDFVVSDFITNQIFQLWSSDWNGEVYTNSTKTKDGYNFENTDIVFKPIYHYVDGQYVIIDFEN